MPVGTLLLVAAIALLVLIPTRRLFVAGLSEGALATYFVAMVALGLLVAELRGPARYLVPILVLAYVAPFVTFRAGIARLGGRRPPRAVVRPAPIRRIELPHEAASSSDESDATRPPATERATTGPPTAEPAEPEDDAGPSGRG